MVFRIGVKHKMKKIIATVMSAALLTGLISGTTVTNLQAAEVNTAGGLNAVQETTEQTNEIDSFDAIISVFSFFISYFSIINNYILLKNRT